MPILPRLRNALADFLYPPRCVGCGAFDTFLCHDCRGELVPATAGPRCPNCAARWEGEGNCPRCFHCEALERLLAGYEMAGPARQLAHALKYQGVTALAPIMAGLMAPIRDAASFDIALPVPLHRTRLRGRGFNQAEVLLEALGWPRGSGRLLRLRNTDSQVGLGSNDRRRNVAGAFAYEGPRLTGLTIAVVDDVITTGATTNECARVLRDHGARGVVAIAFARASYDIRAPAAPIAD